MRLLLITLSSSIVLIISKETTDPINVFLIGNNPIELSNIYEKLKAIRDKTYKAEISFELKGIYKKIMRFNPACILIDDNLEQISVKKLLSKLSTNSKTKNIPIAMLKNSNSDNNLGNVEEFVLKTGVTGERLSISIANSIKLKDMQRYLSTQYRIKKSQFGRWANS